MKCRFLALIFLITLPFAARANSNTDAWVDWNKWHADQGIASLPIKQQKIGICWSYALTSLMENEFFVERHQHIELAPEYLAFHSLAEVYANHIERAHDDYLDGWIPELGGNAFEVKRENMIVEELDDHSASDDEDANEDLELLGMIPQSALKNPLIEQTEARVHPENNFSYLSNGVPVTIPYSGSPSDLEGVDQYYRALRKNIVSNQNESKTIFQNLNEAFGYESIEPRDTFTFENQNYTAQTFLSNYLHYDPKKLKQYMIHYDHLETTFKIAVQKIEDQLKQGRAVSIELAYLDGYDPDAAKNGVYDLNYCLTKGCSQLAGGHAILVSNVIRDENNQVVALVLQNSYGKHGRDRNGMINADPDQLGFNILTLNYWKKGIDVAGANVSIYYYQK